MNEWIAEFIQRVQDDFDLTGRGSVIRGRVETELDRLQSALERAHRLNNVNELRRQMRDATRDAYRRITAIIYSTDIDEGTLAIVNLRLDESLRIIGNYTPQSDPSPLIPIVIGAGITLLLSRNRAADVRRDLGGSAAQLERIQAIYRERVAELARLYSSGQIDLAEWTERMRAAVRMLHTRTVVSVYGENLDYEALRLMQQQIDTQIAYLNRWATQLTDREVTEAGLINRGNLYTGASNETYARTVTGRVGLPEMPFYPAQSTTCRTNCKCAWRYIERGPGDWDCYWVLAEAEHCGVCLARAQVARPLLVRNGQIVDPQRYSARELFA